MNIVVILGDNTTRKQYQLQNELDRLNRLSQLNNIIIKQQDQHLEELKGFAHDYKKQIQSIKELIEMCDGKHSLLSDLQEYSDEMLKNIESNYQFAFIPSTALRAILSKTQLYCNSFGITFHTDIQYADFSFMDFPDLYCVFENPLENAITACKKINDNSLPKMIDLAILRKKNLIWIKIVNTKCNSIIEKNGCMQTTKSDPSVHGLGIKNIKRTISHYNGYTNISYNVTEFTIIMAVPVPTNK